MLLETSPQLALTVRLLAMRVSAYKTAPNVEPIESRVSALLDRMSLPEKIGQMTQLDASEEYPSDYLGERLRSGQLGSVLNQVDVHTVNELQRIAVEESRLGIPLLVGRDVIHGFKTVLPIPIGQAATWNPEPVSYTHLRAHETYEGIS